MHSNYKYDYTHGTAFNCDSSLEFVKQATSIASKAILTVGKFSLRL